MCYARASGTRRSGLRAWKRTRPTRSFPDELLQAAATLEDRRCAVIEQPTRHSSRLKRLMRRCSTTRPTSLDSNERRSRIESMVRGIERRVGEQLRAWQSMLGDMQSAPVNDDEHDAGRATAPPTARTSFVGLVPASTAWTAATLTWACTATGCRPDACAFAEFVMGRAHAHGVVVTSATLARRVGR